MPQSIPRRYSITDGILLFAAVATGSALERLVRDNMDFHHATQAHRLNLLWNVERAAGPYVLMLAIFLLIARFLPPRPRFWRIVRQPGTITCVLVVFDFLRVEQYMLREAIHFHQKLFPATPHGPLLGYSFYAFQAAASHSGSLIALTWLIMALARAWAPEPSWIDRSGRWLGWVLVLDAMVGGLVI